MVFTSAVFILAFLPLVIAIFAVAMRVLGRDAAMAWLVLASLFFYGWWDWPYLLLISLSVSANYMIGNALGSNRSAMLLGVGVGLNLLALGYFKYTNFLLDAAYVLFGGQSPALDIALPLAISFFTFQQIAYLVDVYQGQNAERNFLRYGLFVCFFPQFIAGPIVHHKEIIPQFVDRNFKGLKLSNVLIGATIFAIGFDKKVFIADSMATLANPVFDNAIPSPPHLIDAWVGSLAYTFQLYFDFSGYSDMAIGLARIFGIRLPINFNSPYKALDIIDFWRRWHMTLSRFLRDYLYVPLGGSRRGTGRRYVNLMIVMLLGGLWHGAGWTFVVWGGLHGVYLIINHGWRYLGLKIFDGNFGQSVSRLITFVAVVFAWVFFRAESGDEALVIISGMIGANGIVLPLAVLDGLHGLGDLLQSWGVSAGSDSSANLGAVLWISLLLMIVWYAPNTQEIMSRYDSGLGFDKSGSVHHMHNLTAWLDRRKAIVLIPLFSASVILALLLAVSRGGVSNEFIYMIF